MDDKEQPVKTAGQLGDSLFDDPNEEIAEAKPVVQESN